jgi:hypothetical protein
MSGISPPGAALGPILQITGSGGIVITNPFGPITDVGGAGMVTPCASYAVAGRMEVATQAESFAGTYLGGSGCPLALSPVNQSVREEAVSGAIFTPFSSPVTVLGFGAYSLDLQPNRTNVANLASGARSNCLGQDNRATGGNGSCLGQNNISTGTRGICFGSTNHAYADNAVAIGYRNEAGTAAGNLGENTAVGRSNSARGRSSVAVGTMNNVAAPANLNNATGVIGGDPQLFFNGGVNSTAIGAGNQVSSPRGSGIGFKNVSSGGDDITCVGGFNYGASDFVTAVGFTNSVSGARGSAFGYQNTIGAGLSSVAIGRSNFNVYSSSVNVGIMNNALTPGNLDNTTGAIVNDPQTTNWNAVNSSAFGIANLTSGLRSTALGFKNDASGIGATAVGDRAVARIDNTMNLAGPLIIRKDDGEPIADAFRVFAGAEVIIMTDEVNLTAVADQTITLPAGCHFWFTECGIILTELTGVIASQPTVRMGITGTPAKYVGPVATTLLTATLKRERYDNWQVDDGETSLVAGVTVGAVVGTSMSGRFYFRGVLVEDE